MKQLTFCQWLKFEFPKETPFGKFALGVFSMRDFPNTLIEYDHLHNWVKANKEDLKKYVPYPEEVFDRMYIAYAIEWFEDFTKPLKRHRDRANGKNQDY
jgi:hypothetical protein